MEQGPGEWEREAEQGKVRAAENQAVWADPAQQDRQAPAHARSAGTRNRINAEFPVWIGNVPSAGPR